MSPRRLGEVEAFVPLVADAGVEAEVDWGQAQVVLCSEPVAPAVKVLAGGWDETAAV